MMSKTAVGIAAASAGICFIGYCIYFDRKRRNDPLFKQKLRERRRNAKNDSKPIKGSAELPDLSDTESVQRFFMREIQLGEELLAQGDIESGVEHLSNAIAVCGQPQQLLQVLQQTLPPQVFHLLAQSLSGAKMRPQSTATVSTLDDDLE